MHYYKRNIGDYAKKAGRLTMLQHGSYTLLRDACYDREQFPTLEEAIDWTWASSAAEIEAVEFVLRKFFVLEDGRYVEKSIQEDIAEYHKKSEINARIAKERETKRKDGSTKRARSADEQTTEEHEATPNQEPLTKNQEPETKKEPIGSSLGRGSRRTRIPADFAPNETGLRNAAERGIAVADELPKFIDYHTARGTVMVDWQAAWRTWVGNAQVFAANAPRHTPNQPINRQTALEARNRAVAAEWLAMQGDDHATL